MEHVLLDYLLAVSDPGTDTAYHLGKMAENFSINHNPVLRKYHAWRELARDEVGTNIKQYALIEWRNL
jgi:hypothetical protein